MTKKLRYLCTLLLVAVVSVAWAGEETATITIGSFTDLPTGSASYNTYSWTQGGISGRATIYANQNSTSMQFNASNYLFYSTSAAPGTIKSVKLTTASGTNRTYEVYGSTTAYTGSGTSYGTQIGSQTVTTSGTTYTVSSGDYAYFTVVKTGSGAGYLASVEVTYETTGGSTAVATTVTIDASGITNTDVYTGTDAGSLSATVTETESGDPVSGATVTWSGNNDAVATIDASTGAVTLVKAGSVTFTASYAGVTDEYQASSATYEMTVTSSAPYTQPMEIEITPNYEFWGKTAQFSGSTYDELSGSKDNVSLTWSRGTGSTYANTTAMRFYKDNTLTFTAPTGYEIKSIEFTYSQAQTDLVFSPEGYSTETTTWTGSSQTVTVTRPSNAPSYAQITKITIVIGEPSSDPSISAEDVNIAYDATGGSIAFTVNNEVTGGSISATTTDSWITLGSETSSPISFTCDANNGAERTATVTLTYSFDNESVEKTVTITQAAAPVIYTTIPALFEAATSTAAEVNVTFDNWVVSGVSSNTAFVTDGTNGFVIYGNNHGFVVGNTLTSTSAITCNLQLRNGYAQITNITSATEGLTVGTGGTVEAANIAMADLAGVNTGALVSYENLTCSISNNRYYLSDGTTTIQVYTTLYSDLANSLEDGKIYNITGIYQQYNTTKEILPRDANDIVEVVSEEPSITVSPAEVNATAEETDGTLAISYENLEISDVTDFEVQYYDVTGAPISSEPEWVAVEVTVGTAGYKVSYIIENNTNSEERTAYFKVMALDNDANEVYSNLVTVTQEGFSSTGSFTFEQTSATAGTLTGEPTGVTYQFNNTYTSNKEQLTAGNSMTLTIKGMPANYKVTGITLTVKNNASKGNGTATVSIGKKEIGTLDVTGLGSTYGDQDVTIIPSFATSDLVINIAATENSVYCKKFTIEYEIMDYVGVTIKEDFTATTFSCDKALDFSNVEGITAYIITDDKGATTQVTKVPAGKGLYIVGAEGDYEVPFLADETEPDDVSANWLIPTDGTQIQSDESVTYYAFGKQNGKEAFYKVPTSGYTPSANKAVLVVNAPASSAKEMIVIGGDVTGIESIENGIIVNDNYYTIDGKLVKGQPTQKGIYVVNGRKVVIK